MYNPRVASEVHSSFSARQLKQFSNFDLKSMRDVEDLKDIGIHLPHGMTKQMVSKMAAAMDAIQPTITTASIPDPVQFLQEWLPGLVNVITAIREIDNIVGISTVGAWEDEQVVQGILEMTGGARPYGDYTNVPFASWNVNWNAQTVIRFEQGMQVNVLEEKRAGRVRIDSAGTKRNSAALALEISRNTVGFSGFISGNNNTYGLLNAPGTPAYTNVPNGASGSPLWANKTFLEIQKDIRTAIATLRNQSQGNINPDTVKMTMAVATAAVDYLSTTSDFGISVIDWLNKAYPQIRVVNAPQLNAANGGANVFYLFADAIDDGSTDDGKTYIQPVPAKFLVLGVQQMAKGYEEDYSNATAGVMLKRPWAVVRRSGI